MIHDFILELETSLRTPLEVPFYFKDNYVLLASFPKSGNTWLRFMMSYITKEVYSQSVDVNFSTIEYLTPVIRNNIFLNNSIRPSSDSPIFLKTHFPWIDPFHKYRSVLLVRKPIPTLKSYYTYLSVAKNIKFDSVKSFLLHPRYGISAWIFFHKRWLNKSTVLIKYEDLVAKTNEVLKNMFITLDLDISSNLIDDAIHYSSQKNMSDLWNLYMDNMIKSKYSKRVSDEVNNYQFVKNKNSNIEFSPSEIDLIKSRTQDIYEKYYTI